MTRCPTIRVKHVRLVQDMYESSITVVMCAIGVMDGFKLEVGLHQGSALSPFSFAMVMDRLTDEVRQESLWTMMLPGKKRNESQSQRDRILECE